MKDSFTAYGIQRDLDEDIVTLSNNLKEIRKNMEKPELYDEVLEDEDEDEEEDLFEKNVDRPIVMEIVYDLGEIKSNQGEGTIKQVVIDPEAVFLNGTKVESPGQQIIVDDRVRSKFYRGFGIRLFSADERHETFGVSPSDHHALIKLLENRRVKITIETIDDQTSIIPTRAKTDDLVIDYERSLSEG